MRKFLTGGAMAVTSVNWNWARICVINTDLGNKHTNDDDAEL